MFYKLLNNDNVSNDLNEETLFDLSNPYILKNLSMNTLVLGGTGSGKTSSVIIPFLNSMVKENLPSLIIDVKNNFVDHIYKIEQLHKKESRIIEIGSFNTAKNINLLNGLNRELVKRILKDIVLSKDSLLGSSYWDDKGLLIFEDVIDVYYYLYEKNIISTPSLFKILSLLNNREDLKHLYTKYTGYQNEDIEVNSKVKRIKADKFHLLNPPSSTDSKFEEQISWTIGKVIMVFSKFLEPLMVEKFSNEENKDFELNFETLYYKNNNIVALRFDYEYFDIGRIVSLFVKIKSIKDIQKFKTKNPHNEKHVITIIDEFQDVVSFDGPYQDDTWFDKCREFKNINIISTQTIASLYKKTENKYKVDTLIANCRNKILLNNDETNTVTYFSKYLIDNAPINLITLNKCIILYFCSKQKNVVSKYLNLNVDIEQKLKSFDIKNNIDYNAEEHILEIKNKISKQSLFNSSELNFNLVDNYRNFLIYVLDFFLDELYNKDENLISEHKHLYTTHIINYKKNENNEWEQYHKQRLTNVDLIKELNQMLNQFIKNESLFNFEMIKKIKQYAYINNLLNLSFIFKMDLIILMNNLFGAQEKEVLYKFEDYFKKLEEYEKEELKEKMKNIPNNVDVDENFINLFRSKKIDKINIIYSENEKLKEVINSIDKNYLDKIKTYEFEDKELKTSNSINILLFSEESLSKKDKFISFMNETLLIDKDSSINILGIENNIIIKDSMLYSHYNLDSIKSAETMLNNICKKIIWNNTKE